jgi:hypothetical protein
MMSKVRKTAIGAVLVSAGLTAAPAAQAAAGAAATIYGCPGYHFCFYFNSGYAGARADYLLSDANLGDELFNKVGTTSNRSIRCGTPPSRGATVSSTRPRRRRTATGTRRCSRRAPPTGHRRRRTSSR